MLYDINYFQEEKDAVRNKLAIILNYFRLRKKKRKAVKFEFTVFKTKAFSVFLNISK